MILFFFFIRAVLLVCCCCCCCMHLGCVFLVHLGSSFSLFICGSYNKSYSYVTHFRLVYCNWPQCTAMHSSNSGSSSRSENTEYLYNSVIFHFDSMSSCISQYYSSTIRLSCSELISIDLSWVCSVQSIEYPYHISLSFPNRIIFLKYSFTQWFFRIFMQYNAIRNTSRNMSTHTHTNTNQRLRERERERERKKHVWINTVSLRSIELRYVKVFRWPIISNRNANIHRNILNAMHSMENANRRTATTTKRKTYTNTESHTHKQCTQCTNEIKIKNGE